MADGVHIEVRGLDKLVTKFDQFREQINKSLQSAAKESLTEVLDTQGLRKYPPETDANRPPYPYYERGRGTWTGPGYNTGSSERYGTRWDESVIPYGAKAVNNASYAPYLAGEEQSSRMAEKGWRKLGDVAEEKRGTIKKIFDGWIDRLVKNIGL